MLVQIRQENFQNLQSADKLINVDCGLPDINYNLAFKKTTDFIKREMLDVREFKAEYNKILYSYS